MTQFDAVWEVIKDWDIQRKDGDGYAHATRTDVETILNSVANNTQINKETLESVFMGLPDSCVLKTPNFCRNDYTASYKEHSKNAVTVHGSTPTEVVVNLARKLAPEE